MLCLLLMGVTCRLVSWDVMVLVFRLVGWLNVGSRRAYMLLRILRTWLAFVAVMTMVLILGSMTLNRLNVLLLWRLNLVPCYIR